VDLACSIISAQGASSTFPVGGEMEEKPAYSYYYVE